MTIYNISAVNHINELRYRLTYIVFSALLTFSVSYLFSLELFYVFAKPLLNLNIENFEYSLIYTDITEAFFTYLNISIYTAIFFSILLSIHHLTYFIIPGLFYNEMLLLKRVKRNIYIVCLFSILVTYFLVIPIMWHFFLSNDTSNTISSMNIHFEGKLNEYIFILLKIFFSIFCVCTIPLVLFVLVKLNFISINVLIKQRKFAFIGLFFIGALLSPPDVMSQILLAIPLCFSYELVILLIMFNDTY